MSFVLFLAHRSRARVNARVLARRKRDETRRMAAGGEEGARRARSERGRRIREGAKERGKQIVRTFCTRESTCSVVVSGAAKGWRRGRLCIGETRIGEDRTRWAARERGRDIGTVGAKWMDGPARKARAKFVCPFRRERPPARIDSPPRRSDINARISGGIIPR